MQPPKKRKKIRGAYIGAFAVVIAAIIALIGLVFFGRPEIIIISTPTPTIQAPVKAIVTPTAQAPNPTPTATLPPSPTPKPTAIPTPSERAATINDPWVRAYKYESGFGTSVSIQVAPREIAVFAGGPITFTAASNAYSFPTADNAASILAYVGTQAQGQITETIDNLSPGNTDLTIFNVPSGISLSSAKDVAVQFIWEGMQMKGNCVNQQGCTVEYYATVDARTQVIFSTNVSSFPVG